MGYDLPHFQLNYRKVRDNNNFISVSTLKQKYLIIIKNSVLISVKKSSVHVEENATKA